jgi:hypothetical protein
MPKIAKKLFFKIVLLKEVERRRKSRKVGISSPQGVSKLLQCGSLFKVFPKMCILSSHL